MNQLQLSEMVFALNNRIHPNDAGSLILRFFGRDVRGSLPNSLDRNLNWRFLIENRGKIHQKRVEKKGRCSKESYVVGEKVLVENVVSKLWDREAVITGVRTAAENTIVSYNLDIGGLQSIRHRKSLRKIANLPNEDEVAEDNIDRNHLKMSGFSSRIVQYP